MVFMFTYHAAVSQHSTTKPTYVTLSGGHVAFGTGVAGGFGVGLEVSRNIIDKPSPFVAQLLVGGELFFESGVSAPVTQNPPLNGFFFKSFDHHNHALLWLKAAYYPFQQKIVRGLHLQIGPTLGYKQRTTEREAYLVSLGGGEFQRRSVLRYDNGAYAGYRISVGYELPVATKCTAGVRADFSNNTRGDINTLLGVKFGYRLN
ncbi:hypothetical protein [Phnomibacter sp. MR]|uniref:hypothetical protein n=1 Tax=Phnomibacter sp. MR TaxID=3042318 RepID=UPI003A810781